jgi:hypothetical protein
MRALLPLLASLGMALSALGLAFAAPGDERRDLSAARLTAATAGAVHLVNSREGTAVLGAQRLRPGDEVSGTVRIGNDGALAGRLVLRRGAVSDTPGVGGGRLSDALQLSIFDITNPAAPTTLYAGPLTAFSEVAAGTVARGGDRQFRLAARLAPPAGDDNRFQNATTSLGLEWGATPVPAAATPTRPPVTPKPPVTVKPKPPTAPAPPAPAVPLADALGLPRATTCVRSRTLRFKLRTPNGARLRSATVAVNRKVKVKGRKALKRITLRKLPKRRATVAVTVKAADRKTYKASRTYAACTTRRS